jgi:hypothetical protein
MMILNGTGIKQDIEVLEEAVRIVERHGAAIADHYSVLTVGIIRRRICDALDVLRDEEEKP